MTTSYTPGSNLKYGSKRAMINRLMRALIENFTPDADAVGSGASTPPRYPRPAGYKRSPHICTKTSDTAPQSSTAADAPMSVNDLCLHYNAAGTFLDLYMCTAYTHATSFTWTKIVD